MITCKACLRAINHYLDRELEEQDVLHVRDHLDACPPCLDLFQFEAGWRGLVRGRCREQVAPDTLKERILARLHEERQRAERRGGRSPTV